MKQPNFAPKNLNGNSNSSNNPNKNNSSSNTGTNSCRTIDDRLKACLEMLWHSTGHVSALLIGPIKPAKQIRHCQLIMNIRYENIGKAQNKALGREKVDGKRCTCLA